MARVEIYSGHIDETRTLLLGIDNVERCSYDISTDAMEIGLPEQNKSMIMALGGVLRHISVEWTETTDDISSTVTLLMGDSGTPDNPDDDLISGNITQEWSVDIDSWGLSENCIVKSVDIQQVGGQSGALKCSMKLIVGNFFPTD